MSHPIPAVAARKYPGPGMGEAAKVKFRVKGSTDAGHVYHGQTIIIPCKTCKKPHKSES